MSSEKRKRNKRQHKRQHVKEIKPLSLPFSLFDYSPCHSVTSVDVKDKRQNICPIEREREKIWFVRCTSDTEEGKVGGCKKLFEEALHYHFQCAI